MDMLSTLKAEGRISFTYGDLSGKTKEQIEQAERNVLEMVLRGEFTEMKPINDSKGRK